MNSVIQGFPQNNDNMFLDYKFLEMGAACVPNIRVCGGKGMGLSSISFSEMSQCQHLLRDTGPVSAGLPESRRGRAVCAMVTGPGGGGGAAELRPSAAQQQLMSVIDFAGCGTVTVRRTSDSSTTTHSFLHHATKTQQQLNLETVESAPAAGTLRGAQSGWRECPGSEGRMGGGDGRC